jgi:predicted nucleic acid-binding protein
LIYADTSFVYPLYLTDAHSRVTALRMRSRPEIWLSPLQRCELAHALEQQVFRRTASERDARVAFRDFEHDCAVGVWRLVPFPSNAFETCAELAHRYTARLGARTLDALHVATALELGARSFWTFDERQRKLAEAAGLQTS